MNVCFGADVSSIQLSFRSADSIFIYFPLSKIIERKMKVYETFTNEFMEDYILHRIQPN